MAVHYWNEDPLCQEGDPVPQEFLFIGEVVIFSPVFYLSPR